jgi:hypothetical protein
LLYYFLFFIFGFFAGLIIFVCATKHRYFTQKAGYIKINLDDLDTNQIQIHWTDARKIFNNKRHVIFDVVYVRDGIVESREKN